MGGRGKERSAAVTAVRAQKSWSSLPCVCVPLALPSCHFPHGTVRTVWPASSGIKKSFVGLACARMACATTLL